MVEFKTEGRHLRKDVYEAWKKEGERKVLFATISWNGVEWVTQRLSGRIDRFDLLADAKDDARKG